MTTTQWVRRHVPSPKLLNRVLDEIWYWGATLKVIYLYSITATLNE